MLNRKIILGVVTLYQAGEGSLRKHNTAWYKWKHTRNRKNEPPKTQSFRKEGNIAPAAKCQVGNSSIQTTMKEDGKGFPWYKMPSPVIPT